MTEWTAPPRPAPLPTRQQVHLWRLRLPAESEPAWRDILTAEEREHAHRFHFQADRRRFTVTRAVLRTILAEYLDTEACSLRFLINEYGKPSLAPEHNPAGISFSVSHSGDCSLLAFGGSVEVGVDVEDLRKGRDVMGLGKAVLAPSEYREFLGLPGGERRLFLFQRWTRREAVAKALGRGLSAPLDQLEAAAKSDDWSVRSIDIGEDYAAALAVRSPNIELRTWDRIAAGGTVSSSARSKPAAGG